MVLDTIAAAAASIGISRQELLTTWEPLALYVVGMAVYGIFVFELYHFISRKNIFELDLQEYAHGWDQFKNVLRVGLHIVKYLVVYPILPVVWFIAFTALIAVLSAGRAIPELLLVSMAVVSAIRIGAYYDERLAEDMAKMIPLALLGIFIVDGIQSLTLADVFRVVTGMAAHWETILYYWLFTILLELVLRILDSLWRRDLETTPGENEQAEMDAEEEE